MKEKLGSIIELCKKINMPAEALNDIKNIVTNYSFNNFKFYFDAVKQGNYEKYKEVNEKIENFDDLPTIQLVLLLAQAVDVFEIYKKMQIQEQIYYDTMSAFTRFLNESKMQCGQYKFDREFWAYRHVNMSIFRIGELEFEFRKCPEDIIINKKKIVYKDENVIAVHIPSDAKLTCENCNNTYIKAREFYSKHYKQYSNAYFTCKTWLLSPQLKKLLSKSSNILNFEKYYTIYGFEESDQFKNWVFGHEEMKVEDYPENTSLQRAVKKHVLQGGKIGVGSGIILDY